MALMQQPAVEAIMFTFNHGKIGGLDEECFVFSDDFSQLHITPHDASTLDERGAIAAYGDVLLNCIIASPHHPKRLLAIAHDCIDGRMTSLDDLHLQLERRLSNTIYVPIILIILVSMGVLYWLNN